MSRRAFLGSALTGALFSSAVPVVALLLLSPTQYGLFSIPYLLVALGLSLQLSVVAEAWVRSSLAGRGESPWPRYWSALLALSAACAAVVGAVSLFIPQVQPWWWAAMSAGFLALLRTGARYYWASRGHYTTVIRGDVLGVVAFGLALAVSAPLADEMGRVMLAWLAAGVAAVLANGRTLLTATGTPWAWWREHRASIRPLLVDSLLLDAGSVGTPLMLAPLLGPAAFGIYRGIANVALPVRLILDPLRPAIARRATGSLHRAPTAAAIIGAAAVLSAMCFVVLEFAVPVIAADLGTLGALSPWALPSAAFVLTSFVSQVYYVASRARTPFALLIRARIIQSIAAISLPLVGFFALGLAGAIWGYVVATLGSAVIWFVVSARAAESLEPVTPS